MYSSPRHYMEVSNQLHAPAPLPREKSPPPQYPLNRRMAVIEPQSFSSRYQNNIVYASLTSYMHLLPHPCVLHVLPIYVLPVRSPLLSLICVQPFK